MRSATPQPRRPHAAAYATSLAFGALKGIHEGEVLGEAGHIVQRQVRWRSLGDIVDIFFKIPFKALPFDLDQIVGTDRILRAVPNYACPFVHPDKIRIELSTKPYSWPHPPFTPNCLRGSGKAATVQFPRKIGLPEEFRLCAIYPV